MNVRSLARLVKATRVDKEIRPIWVHNNSVSALKLHLSARGFSIASTPDASAPDRMKTGTKRKKASTTPSRESYEKANVGIRHDSASSQDASPPQKTVKIEGGVSASAITTQKKPSSNAYCSVPPRTNAAGEDIWPAPFDQISRARDIIRECAESNATTVICPDKDADGLSAGVILYHTLTTLGLSESKIETHLLPKGESIHTEAQRAQLTSLLSSGQDSQSESTTARKRYLFVLDHGSARSPSLAPPAITCTLIIDHHNAEDDTFPENSEHVTAYDCPPVPTSALLTYEICKTLHPGLSAPSHKIAWLAVTGTHGDLGTSLKWSHPFPDPKPIFDNFPRTQINSVVSLINAPRRTSDFDSRSAWDVLVASKTPQDLLESPKSQRLVDAREEVNREVVRCQAYAPKFSYDSTVALVRIESRCQVHPVIATRWAGTLKGAKKLKYVICANEGYLPGKVNFSCRVAKGAEVKTTTEKKASVNGAPDEAESIADGSVNIIAELKSLARRHPSGTLLERLGDDFGRGHVQASGGIVPTAAFEELMSVLRIGEKPPKEDKSPKKPVQKNKLTGYFGKATN